MTKKKLIKKMTPQQEKLVPVYRDKWLKNGRRIERLDRKKAEDAIKTIYACAKMEEPKYFFFFPSPIQCQLAVNVMRSSGFQYLLKEESNLWSNLESNLWSNLESNLWSNLESNLRSNLQTRYENTWYGNIDWNVGWGGFYDFILNELFEEKISEYKEFLSYLDAMQNIHVFIPYKDIVFYSDRPTTMNLNANGRLHATDAPALMYADGYSLFYMNGVCCPKILIETTKDKITKEMVLGEKNVDVRREVLRKVGVESFIAKIGGKTIHKYKDYELIEVDLEDGKLRRGLKMQNPSIDAIHFERVSDECKTVQEALAWRNQLSEYIEPEILT